MKMTKSALLAAVAAAALAASQNLRAADFSTSDLTNRAVVGSPRALEQFPWLARQASPRKESPGCCAESVLSAIKKNRAFAASPRVREQFPELDRTGQSSIVASAKSGTRNGQLATVAMNRALARSPRMLEEFPELARAYPDQSATKSIEIAPLK